jgi:hypothetical protein
VTFPYPCGIAVLLGRILVGSAVLLAAQVLLALLLFPRPADSATPSVEQAPRPLAQAAPLRKPSPRPARSAAMTKNKEPVPPPLRSVSAPPPAPLSIVHWYRTDKLPGHNGDVIALKEEARADKTLLAVRFKLPGEVVGGVIDGKQHQYVLTNLEFSLVMAGESNLATGIADAGEFSSSFAALLFSGHRELVIEAAVFFVVDRKQAESAELSLRFKKTSAVVLPAGLRIEPPAVPREAAPLAEPETERPPLRGCVCRWYNGWFPAQGKVFITVDVDAAPGVYRLGRLSLRQNDEVLGTGIGLVPAFSFTPRFTGAASEYRHNDAIPVGGMRPVRPDRFRTGHVGVQLSNWRRRTPIDHGLIVGNDVVLEVTRTTWTLSDQERCYLLVLSGIHITLDSYRTSSESGASEVVANAIGLPASKTMRLLFVCDRP